MEEEITWCRGCGSRLRQPTCAACASARARAVRSKHAYAQEQALVERFIRERVTFGDEEQPIAIFLGVVIEAAIEQHAQALVFQYGATGAPIVTEPKNEVLAGNAPSAVRLALLSHLHVLALRCRTGTGRITVPVRVDGDRMNYAVDVREDIPNGAIVVQLLGT